MAEDGLTRGASEAAGRRRWYLRLARPYCVLWDACYNYMRVTWMGNLRTSRQGSRRQNNSISHGKYYYWWQGPCNGPGAAGEFLRTRSGICVVRMGEGGERLVEELVERSFEARKGE